MEKIQSNRERDERDEAKLLAAGWRVLTVWECALKGKQKRSVTDIVDQVAKWILEPDASMPHLDIRHRDPRAGDLRI
jgi:DNA mismatch endonuclease (patch repair protein)